MSEAVSNRIKQLENQNEKFKKLLESTLEITSLDSAKCTQLKSDASFLKKVVSDLENQKKQLEDELKLHLFQDAWVSEAKPPVNIQLRLNKALNDIQLGSTEIQQLQVEDDYLKDLIDDLEKEKEQLLSDISLVKKANEENNALAQENLKLRQELALLQSQCSASKVYPSASGQHLIKKLASIESLKQKLEKDIAVAQQCSDPLGNPVENAVLELKISGLDKQKEDILKNIRANLLQSANEVSMLHRNTSDSQLRGLLNELDIHKAILMMNLNEVKEMHFEAHYNTTTTEEGVEKSDMDDPSSVIKEDLLNSVQQHINMKEFLESGEDYSTHSEEYSTPRRTDSGEFTPAAMEASVFPSNDSQLIRVTEIRESEHSIEVQLSGGNFNYCDLETHELQPVSEEDELQNDLLVEQEQLRQELCRLERERDSLLAEIQAVTVNAANISNNQNVLNCEGHGTFMQEESSEAVQLMPLDDATNQMYANEEQLLAQRIRELEEDNARIRRDLSRMLEDSHIDKEDLEVLEEGERLIKDYKDCVEDHVQ